MPRKCMQNWRRVSTACSKLTQSGRAAYLTPLTERNLHTCGSLSTLIMAWAALSACWPPARGRRIRLRLLMSTGLVSTGLVSTGRHRRHRTCRLLCRDRNGLSDCEAARFHSGRRNPPIAPCGPRRTLNRPRWIHSSFRHHGSSAAVSNKNASRLSLDDLWRSNALFSGY
jgi:hypothetical protein